jgi:hypothetical protein
LGDNSQHRPRSTGLNVAIAAHRCSSGLHGGVNPSKTLIPVNAYSRQTLHFRGKLAKYRNCVLGKTSQNCGRHRQHTGRVMRISDDRYDRERSSLDLALQLLL